MRFEIMNKTILKVLTFAAGLAGLASCETYTVDDPETTAVSEFDGRWVCFAYPKASPTEAETVFMIDIFNTTNNDADKFWIRVIDCLPYYGVYYLDCLQFLATCDGKALTFQANEAAAEQPKTCYNIYLEQGYLSAGYAGAIPATGYKASIDGKIVKSSVETAAGTKVDGIEFSYKRVEPSGEVYEYTVKGMKNTGWADDLQEYVDFLENALS